MAEFSGEKFAGFSGEKFTPEAPVQQQGEFAGEKFDATGAAAAEAPAPDTGDAPRPSGSLAAELRGLAELHSVGQLSADEYATCKAVIISRYGGAPPPPAGGGAIDAAPRPSAGVICRPEVSPVRPPSSTAGAAAPPAADAAPAAAPGGWPDSSPLTAPGMAAPLPGSASPRCVVGVPPEEAVFESASPADAAPAEPQVGGGQLCAMHTPLYRAPLETEVAELQRRKVEAAEREDYEEAKRLKELITSMAMRQDGASPRRQHGLSLADRLRRAMCHVDEAGDLAETAEALYAESPQAVYDVIAEYQPTLSESKIQRHWRKVIGIYLEHAVAAGAVSAPGAGADGAPAAEEDVDVMAQIRGVVDFLDAPLSPKTLRDVRDIRKGASPRRDAAAPAE